MSVSPVEEVFNFRLVCMIFSFLNHPVSRGIPQVEYCNGLMLIGLVLVYRGKLRSKAWINLYISP